MTIEEAIESLKSIIDTYEMLEEKQVNSDVPLDGEDIQALDMAISALSAEPCENCISRRAVLELIADYDLSMGQVVKGIHALPSVQPSKKGEWINTKVGKLFPSNDYKCSVCGNILDFDGVNCGRGDANFCPNCGADMRGNHE